MYHIPGITPEARTVEEAFGGNPFAARVRYGAKERRAAYENLNCATERDIDFVMLGCPHNSIEQVWLIASLLEGRKISANTELWVHTPRALREVAERNGYTKMIMDAGGHGHERHVSGDLAPHAEGDQGGRDRFGQAGALSAGHHRRVGLVRLGEGLRRGGRQRPLERRLAMSDVAAPAKAETKIVLRGRKVVGGFAEGEAMVTRDTISGWGGINERDGTVIERRHELRGQSFKDKVLVFPGAKGSSGWSAYFHMARLNGASPRAMIFNKMTTKVALGAVVTHAPAMTELEQDPLQVIETGDWVKVDADNGIVEITKRAR